MASTAERASKVKDNRQGEAREVVEDQLEALAREGARRMLCQALSEEVDAYLGRGRYERTEVYRGYRNGSTPRKLTPGSGTIDVAVPRVRGARQARSRSRARSSASTSVGATPLMRPS